ncbi:FAD:protein FMN transferase [uncultured Dokdonia sp.]|uniref:FAD:protein FMN transferase n=1 Tax=uncultured Dokdonia sp. TaxID=575653 RepID=UPI00262C620F|nr:FAD:protein FMN transferase [uncultured Dokdonia sp.]
MKYITLLLLICCLASCKTDTSSQISIKSEAFGTTYAVTYFGEYEKSPRIRKGIDSVVQVVNRSMSTYIPESDISKINKGDSTIVVDTMFKEVFALSRKLHKLTNGYFDPTVGSLRNAYGFGDTKPLAIIDSIVLDSMMRYVGFDKLALSPKGTVQKKYPEVYIDFNAVAKGYGIDRIATFLQNENIPDFLIELGGEIRAQGRHQLKDKSWVVGVESIYSSVQDRQATVTLRLEDKSMAGSGNYRKNRIDSITGKQYVHTINPLTGSAEKINMLSANVIAPTCAEADAWATAFMAMGVERSKAILAIQKDIDAYLVFSDGENSTSTYVTDGFKQLLTE